MHRQLKLITMDDLFKNVSSYGLERGGTSSKEIIPKFNRINQEHHDPSMMVNFVVNPHKFTYIINNPYLCPQDTDLEYLIYFHTAPDHFGRRQMLRETWAKPNLFPDKPSRTVFFLGATIDSDVQKQIWYESLNYKDIVQENYIDSYRNLTYKAVGAFKWISQYCPRIRYVIKSDDDVILNMYMWRNLLKTTLANEWRFMYGKLYPSNEVFRNKTSKWFVSYQQYPGERYPPVLHWMCLVHFRRTNAGII